MKIKYVVLLSCTLLLVSCATVTLLQPGAEKIPITQRSVPASCRYLGQVSAYDVNGATRMYTSHQILETDQINQLKNQALKLGANVIQLTAHQTTYTPRHRRSGVFIDQHRLAGHAYRCSHQVAANLHDENISDIKSKDE